MYYHSSGSQLLQLVQFLSIAFSVEIIIQKENGLSQKLIKLMKRKVYFVMFKIAPEVVRVNLHPNVAYGFLGFSFEIRLKW